MVHIDPAQIQKHDYWCAGLNGTGECDCGADLVIDEFDPRVIAEELADQEYLDDLEEEA